jgi:lipoprotein signal peptidase
LVLVVDLGHKAAVIDERGDELLFHERSLGYAVGVTVGSLAWCAAIVATRSVMLAVPGGLVLGGAAGNVVSWALWPSYAGTPNTFLVGDERLGLAFNLADAFVVGAVFGVLPVALAVFTARNRQRLREPIRLRG